MHIANIVGPFGRISGWQSFGWHLTPASPHLGGRRVFLTDARAISYSESVMGYVADLKLATIIGSATAGANGGAATFTVPSGYSTRFTGMRVTGHDGKAQHHLVGVKPE
jgi:C-terminal processing protease CtpA/Prc